MKIKHFLLAIGIVGLLFGVWKWLWSSDASEGTSSKVLASSPASSPPTQKPSKLSWITSDKGRPHKVKLHYPWTSEEEKMMAERAAELAHDPSHDWKAQIDFQALVIDQDNKPVPGASVKWCSANNYGNGSGAGESDKSGRFSIETTGKGMDVSVFKDGYVSLDGHQGFEFANFTDRNYYDSDYDHPVIFHLRKIPPAEPIYIWSGSSQMDLINEKTSINPQTGKVSQGEKAGEIWIELVPGPHNSSDQKQYGIVVGAGPGGGVIATDVRADSFAPDSRYETLVDTHQIIGFEGSAKIEMRIFFKDQNTHYGMADFDLRLQATDIRLGYTIRYNPSGGRSLSAEEGSEFQINKDSEVRN